MSFPVHVSDDRSSPPRIVSRRARAGWDEPLSPRMAVLAITGMSTALWTVMATAAVLAFR